ncbi:biliverdin-producing heme oxygenase [Candidatus Phyllobacterium onerii]|uniref:biliverdin-producing heme oxygenase n=1 Tax=Candidatus Phyllobacterium onerii TaxID=3020828 RepID=UPI003A8B266A
MHRQLDIAVNAAGFLGQVDLYRRYLAATWHAWQPLEVILDASDAARHYPLWPQRRLLSSLAADMADLDVTVPVTAARRGKLSVWDTASVMGTLYVLEGSALGARILAGRLRNIGMTADFGARHIAVQTGNPKAWKSFLKILEATAMTSLEEDRCISAAQAAFNVFEFHYSRADRKL